MLAAWRRPSTLKVAGMRRRRGDTRKLATWPDTTYTDRRARRSRTTTDRRRPRHETRGRSFTRPFRMTVDFGLKAGRTHARRPADGGFDTTGHPARMSSQRTLPPPKKYADRKW